MSGDGDAGGGSGVGDGELPVIRFPASLEVDSHIAFAKPVAEAEALAEALAEAEAAAKPGAGAAETGGGAGASPVRFGSKGRAPKGRRGAKLSPLFGVPYVVVETPICGDILFPTNLMFYRKGIWTDELGRATTFLTAKMAKRKANQLMYRSPNTLAAAMPFPVAWALLNSTRGAWDKFKGGEIHGRTKNPGPADYW